MSLVTPEELQNEIVRLRKALLYERGERVKLDQEICQRRKEMEEGERKKEELVLCLQKLKQEYEKLSADYEKLEKGDKSVVSKLQSALGEAEKIVSWKEKKKMEVQRATSPISPTSPSSASHSPKSHYTSIPDMYQQWETYQECLHYKNLLYSLTQQAQ